MYNSINKTRISTKSVDRKRLGYLIPVIQALSPGNKTPFCNTCYHLLRIFRINNTKMPTILIALAYVFALRSDKGVNITTTCELIDGGGLVDLNFNSGIITKESSAIHENSEVIRFDGEELFHTKAKFERFLFTELIDGFLIKPARLGQSYSYTLEEAIMKLSDKSNGENVVFNAQGRNYVLTKSENRQTRYEQTLNRHLRRKEDNLREHGTKIQGG